MGAEHVIAMIAALLQVRNAVLDNTAAQKGVTLGSHQDTVDEARELLQRVVDDRPQIPNAQNTK